MLGLRRDPKDRKSPADLPPPRKTAREARFYDIGPAGLLIAVALVAIVGGSLLLWKRPDLRRSLVSMFAETSRPVKPPSRPEPTPELASKGGFRAPEAPTIPPPQPKPREDQEQLRARRDRELRDRAAVEQKQREIEELRNKAVEEQKRLLQLQEQAAREAVERAQKQAEAESEARKRAEERAEAARAELERAEKEARAAKAARERTESAAAAKEREAVERAQQDFERIRNYSGPRFGTLTWDGEVRGTEMITLDNGIVSSGTISGSLPGVPVLVQPLEPNRVGIASSPGPRNNYRAMTFRVKGNGRIRLTFRWSLP
jgi:hypothetical protein